MNNLAGWMAALSAALVAILGTGKTAAECTESAAHASLAAFSGPPQAGDTLPQWGYGYDSLLADLARWRQNPLIKVDSFGASTQGRALWSVTITGDGDSLGTPGGSDARKRRVFVHARTHPSEVQAFHIARSMIEFLLDSAAVSRDVLRGYIFNIVPMYNPDGVELMHPRENANLVDIESNWNSPQPEAEVRALKRHFEFLMATPVPVEVALNLHSDRFNCTRFFFYHEAGGTSPLYAELEKVYIGKVRGYFPSGIEDWPFVRSWGTATGTQYPEGFWWLNHRENVMALTYEDANCPGAGEYDSTARALLLGSVDYLALRPPLSARRLVREESRLLPVPGGFRLAGGPGPAYAGWELADLAGRSLGRGAFAGGEAFIPAGPLRGKAGVLTLSGPGSRDLRRLLLPVQAP